MLLRKRFLGIIMTFALVIVSVTFSASAKSVSDVSESGDKSTSTTASVIDLVSPMDNYFPSSSEVWNVSTDGAYTINGTGLSSARLYTMYRIKSNSGEINYTIYNNNNSTPMTIYYYSGNMLSSHTLCELAAGESVSGTIAVKSTSYIVFAFSSPCNVTGTITE